MSKSLRSMSEAERRAAILRRLAGSQRGLGYWAAYDARHKAAEKKAAHTTDIPRGVNHVE